MIWPGGKTFAFSIFDDTDLAVPGNVEDVYEILGSLGLRTTKSVWPICAPGQPPRGPEGSTCEDPEYLRFVLDLQRAGFEIGYHNSSHSGVGRGDVIRALDRFRELFGHDPDCMSNHLVNPEAIYWGPDRLSYPLRALYTAFRSRRPIAYRGGHVPESPHFWGDICQQRIRYVRNFVFADIQTQLACPAMPYFDPMRPMVRAWFTSTYASSWPDFERVMSEANQDRLEASGGLCILYTHFGHRFHDRATGRAQPRFAELMRHLARKNGWFVPVRELLDYVVSQQGVARLDWRGRQALEWRWFYQKLTKSITE
ncbi:MAG: hypothetical protein KDI32_11995 [Pseudomonadales bacterium]|nr:hypothetical protein [Pseudomonadales bacterium]